MALKQTEGMYYIYHTQLNQSFDLIKQMCWLNMVKTFCYIEDARMTAEDLASSQIRRQYSKDPAYADIFNRFLPQQNSEQTQTAATIVDNDRWQYITMD